MKWMSSLQESTFVFDCIAIFWRRKPNGKWARKELLTFNYNKRLRLFEAILRLRYCQTQPFRRLSNCFDVFFLLERRRFKTKSVQFNMQWVKSHCRNQIRQFVWGVWLIIERIINHQKTISMSQHAAMPTECLFTWTSPVMSQQHHHQSWNNGIERPKRENNVGSNLSVDWM